MLLSYCYQTSWILRRIENIKKKISLFAKEASNKWHFLTNYYFISKFSLIRQHFQRQKEKLFPSKYHTNKTLHTSQVNIFENI